MPINPKPTDYPRWDDVQPANRIQPPSGLADTGWAANQIPAAEHMNWLLYTLYTWILYLDTFYASLVSTANTWTAAQVFGALVTLNGGLTVNSGVTINNGAWSFTCTAQTNLAGTNSLGPTTFTSAPSAADYKVTGSQKMAFPALGVNVSNSNNWLANSTGIGMVGVATNPCELHVPLPALKAGDVVTVRLEMMSVGGAGTTNVYLMADAGAGLYGVAGPVTVTSGTSQLVTVVTGHTVANYEALFLKVVGDGVTTCAREVHRVEMDWTHP